MEVQGTQSSQNILKKNKVRELTFPMFKNYLKTTIIKTVWQDKHNDRRVINAIELWVHK